MKYCKLLVLILALVMSTAMNAKDVLIKANDTVAVTKLKVPFEGDLSVIVNAPNDDGDSIIVINSNPKVVELYNDRIKYKDVDTAFIKDFGTAVITMYPKLSPDIKKSFKIQVLNSWETDTNMIAHASIKQKEGKFQFMDRGNRKNDLVTTLHVADLIKHSGASKLSWGAISKDGVGSVNGQDSVCQFINPTEDSVQVYFRQPGTHRIILIAEAHGAKDTIADYKFTVVSKTTYDDFYYPAIERFGYTDEATGVLYNQKSDRYGPLFLVQDGNRMVPDADQHPTLAAFNSAPSFHYDSQMDHLAFETYPSRRYGNFRYVFKDNTAAETFLHNISNSMDLTYPGEKKLDYDQAKDAFYVATENKSYIVDNRQYWSGGEWYIEDVDYNAPKANPPANSEDGWVQITDSAVFVWATSGETTFNENRRMLSGNTLDNNLSWKDVTSFTIKYKRTITEKIFMSENLNAALPGTSFTWGTINNESVQRARPDGNGGLIFNGAAIYNHPSFHVEFNISYNRIWQGICPTGWGLPNVSEWMDITKVITGKSTLTYSQNDNNRSYFRPSERNNENGHSVADFRPGGRSGLDLFPFKYHYTGSGNNYYSTSGASFAVAYSSGGLHSNFLLHNDYVYFHLSDIDNRVYSAVRCVKN